MIVLPNKQKLFLAMKMIASNYLLLLSGYFSNMGKGLFINDVITGGGGGGLAKR